MKGNRSVRSNGSAAANQRPLPLLPNKKRFIISVGKMTIAVVFLNTSLYVKLLEQVSISTAVRKEICRPFVFIIAFCFHFLLQLVDPRFLSFGL